MRYCKNCNVEYEELVFVPFKNTKYDYYKCAECNLKIIFNKESIDDNSV